MSDESRITQLTSILKDLMDVAGANEYSAIFPSAEVVDAAPVDLPATYIRVVGRSGAYEPALKIPGTIYHVGDFVILLYVRGTEAIALAQSPNSGGGGSGGGWPFTNILTVDSTNADADYSTIADALTAAVDGDLIDLNSETFTEDPVFDVSGVGLGCIGPRKAIIAGHVLIDAGLHAVIGIVLHDVDISADYNSSVVATLGGMFDDYGEFKAYNVDILANNDGTDTIAGFYIAATAPVSGYDAELHDCVATATGAGDSYGAYIGDGKVLIDSGRYTGDTAALYVEEGATVELMELPVLVGGIAGTGTVIGPYQDENGVIHNGGGWPFAKVLTVDATDPDADYTNIADAMTAAAAGDIILIGAGTYTCDNVTITAGVSIMGFGRGVTILNTTTANRVLYVANGAGGNYIAGLSITNNLHNVNPTWALYIDSCNNPVFVENVTVVTDNWFGSGHGIYTASNSPAINIFKGVDVTASTDAYQQSGVTTPPHIYMGEVFANSGYAFNGDKFSLLDVYVLSGGINGVAYGTYFVDTTHVEHMYAIQATNYLMPTVSNLTISGGAVTITSSRHRLDTEGSSPSDDLDTINGGTTGQLLVISPVNDARTVVVKHNTGNIWVMEKVDITLDDINDTVTLFYNGTKWCTIIGSSGVALGAGTLTVATTNDATISAHTHAITSSSNPGAAASILASSASGLLQLTGVGVGAAGTAGLVLAGAKAALNSDGGFMVKLTNKTGGNSVKGEVVTPSSGTSNAVTKIVVDVPDPIGVFYESGIADGAEAWIVVAGIADVYFVGNTTRGQFARGFLTADGASYVTGQAMSEALPTSPFGVDKHFYEIGHVLESRVGAGLAKCVLHFN